MQLLIDTEHIHTPPWLSSHRLPQKITNTHLSLLNFFFPPSLLLRGPVNSVCLPSPPHPPLPSPPSVLGPPSFYFLLKAWLELAGERSGEFKLCICAPLQVLPGPRKDREVRASGGGRGEGGMDRGWEIERGEKTRPVQLVSLKVRTNESPPTCFTSALVIYIFPQRSLWFAFSLTFQKIHS